MLSKFTRKKSTGTVAVDLIVTDSGLEAHVREALACDDRFSVASTYRSLGEAEERGLTAVSSGGILLVELDPGRTGELAALERIMHSPGQARPVIAIIDNLNEATVRQLLHLHVADFLPKNGSVDDLVKACERAIRPDNAQSRFSGAKCYSFVSAGGGAGNTTLAIQSAFVIAQKSRQFQSTCLIDMDFQGGVVADYVDVKPSLQLDEVAPSPDRLDTQLLEVMLSRHETGLAVLAAEHALRPYDEVSADLVTRMLDMASVKFESIILDMPRVWLPWSESVLRGSDKVFIVTEMTVPGLRQGRRLLEAIRQQCGDETDVSVIINRFRSSFFSGVNAVRKKDAIEVLGDSLAGFVSEDYPLVREAIDRGVPLTEINKSNKICKDLAQIIYAEPKKNLPQPAPKTGPVQVNLAAPEPAA